MCLASSHFPTFLGNLCCSVHCPRISWEMTTICGRWLHSAKCSVDLTSTDFCCEDCSSPVFTSSVESSCIHCCHVLLPFPVMWEGICKKKKTTQNKNPWSELLLDSFSSVLYLIIISWGHSVSTLSTPMAANVLNDNNIYSWCQVVGLKAVSSFTANRTVNCFYNRLTL